MRRFLLAIVLAFAAACGDSSGPDAGHRGEYTLRSFDGDPLPATLFEDAQDYIRIDSGSLSLDADGSFTIVSTLSYRIEGDAGSETGALVGTYTRSGSTIVLTDTDGEVFTATYDGANQLTITDEGSVLVYRK